MTDYEKDYERYELLKEGFTDGYEKGFDEGEKRGYENAMKHMEELNKLKSTSP